jgi:transcriptional regulator with XRE-family HTH domain
MAINKNKWQQAKAMFEGGSSLSEIADKTDIERSTISKKAKCQGWQKAKNEQLIADDVKLALDKSTLNQHEISYHEQAVEFQLKIVKEIEMFSHKTMTKASNLMDSTDSGSDFKAIIDGVDKLSILTKINDRHARPAQIQQNNQTSVVEAMISLASRLPD